MAIDTERVLDYVRQTYQRAMGGFPSKQAIFSNLDHAFPQWRTEPGLSHAVEQVIHEHADTSAVKPGSSQESSTAATSGSPGGVHPPRGSAQADRARRGSSER